MFGPVVMNGNSAAASVEGFVYTAMNSVYHASLDFMGQNEGAKKASLAGEYVARQLTDERYCFKGGSL